MFFEEFININIQFRNYKLLHFYWIYVSDDSFGTDFPHYLFTLSNILVTNLFNSMNSNKDILDRAIGRPAMMAFMILVGTYVTTGQLIPGVF